MYTFISYQDYVRDSAESFFYLPKSSLMRRLEFLPIDFAALNIDAEICGRYKGC